MNHPGEAVCHRMLTSGPAYYPRAVYQGQTIYFCTEYCQSAFLDDPQRFYLAHGKHRGEPARCDFNPEGTN